MKTLSICIALSFVMQIGLLSAQSRFVQSAKTSDLDSSKATVHIYRYKAFIGYMVEPSVYCDEVQLARMDNGRFFAVQLDTGKHVFRSNDKQSGIELNVKAGQDYYIRIDIVEGMLKQYGRVVLVPNEQGSYEIKKLKSLDANKVKDKSRVVVSKIFEPLRENERNS